MLVEHFAEEFKGKYKVDARTNARAMVRLRAQSEKLKKTLSANPMDLDTPINVECMMEDTDVSGMLRREQLEQMLDKHGYVAKLTNVVQGALDLADLKPGDVDTVEMVGGTSRIPALRAAVSAVFGQDPKTTVNAAESVARGCALAAAMLSPAFRVRDFSVAS
jgi:heat shock protein 4